MAHTNVVIAASLDIGTNTVVVLVATMTANGFDPLFFRSETARLGAGAFADGTLAPDAINRAVHAAARWVAEARDAGATVIHIVGTAAVRDAPNRDVLLRRITEETGLACRVVDGDREASLTFLGATNGESLAGTVAIGDIGGGSTERIVAVDGTIQEQFSLSLGSGRLTERTIHHDPPAADEAAAALRMARETFRDFRPVQARALLVAGGTARALGQMLATDTLGVAALDVAVTRLGAAPAATIAAETGLDTGRVGLLTAGAALVRALAETCGVPAARVSVGGVREGILLASARKLYGFSLDPTEDLRGK